MPIPTPEQQQTFQDLSLALGRAESALDARMQIVRTGNSVAQITRTFPEITGLVAELDSALTDFMQAAYRGEGRDEGRAVGFLMLRGISDMPAGASGWLAGPLGRLVPAMLLPRRKTASGSGTDERDKWKLYASAIAAYFIVSWVASAWPLPPR